MGQPLIDEDLYPEDFFDFDEFEDCGIDECEWCFPEPKSPGRLRRAWDRVVEFLWPTPAELPTAKAPPHEVAIIGNWKGRELFRFTLAYDGVGGLRWVDGAGRVYDTVNGDFHFMLPDEAVNIVIDDTTFRHLEIHGPKW